MYDDFENNSTSNDNGTNTNVPCLYVQAPDSANRKLETM
jgi:hypothetical protein